jgi:hypothetical protein
MSYMSAIESQHTRRSANADSAATATKGLVESIAPSAQAARSNIQAGTSSQRSASDPLSVHRKMAQSALSTASWMQTRSPNHGCQRYKSSRKAVPWAFSNLVVQLCENPSISEQGCADAAGYSNRWAHLCEPNSRRITSSVRSDLIYDRDQGQSAFRTQEGDSE